MQAWTRGVPRYDVMQAELAIVIAAVGRPHFATTVLTTLLPSLDAASWAVYRLRPRQPPVLHFSGSIQVPDVTGDCFAVYRDAGLYQCDTTFDVARARSERNGNPGKMVMLRMRADVVPNLAHRQAIYLRFGIKERLSVVRQESDGSLLAVNFYRHAPQSYFSEDQVAHFGALAPMLLAAVVRHIEWQDEQSTPKNQEADVELVLLRRCPALTERELDVLSRLLRGMTYDGIAADLGLSLSTVKTYRARAFQRLDIRFKSELFSAFVTAAHAPFPLDSGR